MSNTAPQRTGLPPADHMYGGVKTRRRSRWRSCGCLLLLLALLASPLGLAAITTGRLHSILVGIAVVEGLSVLCIPWLVMAFSRSGREELRENLLTAILAGIFGSSSD